MSNKTSLNQKKASTLKKLLSEQKDGIESVMVNIEYQQMLYVCKNEQGEWDTTTDVEKATVKAQKVAQDLIRRLQEQYPLNLIFGELIIISKE
jgi:hypothetical protein